MSLIFRLFVLLPLLISAASVAQVSVPPDLQDWQQWVLKDQQFRECPFYFNRRAAERGDFACAWPGQLELNVAAADARFRQSWSVYADDQWIRLSLIHI